MGITWQRVARQPSPALKEEDEEEDASVVLPPPLADTESTAELVSFKTVPSLTSSQIPPYEWSSHSNHLGLSRLHDSAPSSVLSSSSAMLQHSQQLRGPSPSPLLPKFPSPGSTTPSPRLAIQHPAYAATLPELARSEVALADEDKAAGKLLADMELQVSPTRDSHGSGRASIHDVLLLYMGSSQGLKGCIVVMTESICFQHAWDCRLLLRPLPQTMS
jgi:hypothetical protein